MRWLIFSVLACCCSLLFVTAANAQQAPLSVITTQPQGLVEHLTQVVVRFSEPMRPLGAMEQDPATSPLELSVPGGKLPSGTYRWLDPATLSYLFDEPVTVPLRIDARVPAGIKALSGASLEADVHFTMHTPPLEVDVEAGPLPPQQAVISLRSNYALDVGTLRAKLGLSLSDKPLDFTVSERDMWRQSSGRQNAWIYELHIADTLPADANILLTLDSGLTAREGYEPTGGQQWTFPTFSPLKLERWQAGYSDRDQSMNPDEGVSLTFNQPVRFGAFVDRIVIDPPAERTLSNDDLVYQKDQVGEAFTLPYRWKPRTEYRVTLRAGLEGEYGGALNTDQSFTFTTGDYDPFFFMETGTKIMERSQGGLFPLSLRNIPTIHIRLRYLPWETQYGNLSKNIHETAKDAFVSLPGAVEINDTLDFSTQPNENIVHKLDLPALLGFDGPEAVRGLIHLSATIPASGTNERSYTRTALVQITDLAVTFKQGGESGLVWITDLQGGVPVPEARLTLLDMNGKHLWQGVSDADGLARIPGQATASGYALAAATDTDATLLFMNEAQVPETYNTLYGAASEVWKSHLLTQLPLYQPGQTVRYALYTAWVDRSADGSMPVPDWRPVAEKPITLTIFDSRRKPVHTQEATSNRYGSIAGEFTLPKSANLGHYSIEVSCPDFRSKTFEYGFQVAEFRPPDVKVDLTPPASRPALLPDEPPLSVAIQASYFSGAPLPDGQAVLESRVTPSWFRPSLLSGYLVGEGGDPWRMSVAYQDSSQPSPITHYALDVKLDAQGKATVELPPVEARIQGASPREIELVATVTDASGLTTQGTGSFTLHPSALYVGLRAPRFAPMGKAITLDLKAATWDDKPVSGATVRLVAERSRSSRHDQETAWEQHVVIPNAQGQHVDVRFEQSGTYTVAAEIRDDEGRLHRTVATIWVPGPEMDWISNRASGSLELMADKESYAPGDTATIVLRNPFQEALALIATERDGVRSYEIRRVDGPAPSIEIPLSKDEAPYIYVSVTCIRGRIEAPYDVPGDEAHDLGSPRVAHGTLRLDVKAPEAPRLNLTLTSDKAEFRPGSTASVRIKLTDGTGQGRKGQVTLMAVDNRILRAAGERSWYDPHKTFSPVYAYRVLTADSRIALLNLGAPIMKGQLRMAAFGYADMAVAAPMAEAAPTSGANDLDVAVRENFDPMAFWLGEGETDEQGDLTVSFTTPDTLTSYRIVAVATDAAHFATAEQETTVNQPLQLVSALPRFVVNGDTLEARVLVQNLGEQDGRVSLEASATGMQLETSSATIDLKAGTSGVVGFPARFDVSGEAILEVRAIMGTERDAARFAIPVLPPGPLTTVAAAGLLRQGETYTLPLALPEHLDPRSSFSLIAAPSPAAGLSLVAQELIEYPWHCLEQRLSRAWLRTLRLTSGDLIGLVPASDDKEQVRKTLESVPSFQRADGGFGLWPGMDSSSVYLTVYVLLVNSQTEVLDVSVDDQTLTKARDYLREYLARSYASEKTETPVEVDALALWMLAKTGDQTAADLFVKILIRAEDESAPPLAWAALMMANRDLPGLSEGRRENRRARIRTGLEKLAAVTATHLHFASVREFGHWVTMGSRLRDNGLVLAALTADNPDYPRLEALAAWVGRELGDRTILSTQEAIFGIWSLSSYLKTLGGNSDVALRSVWNKTQSMDHRFTRLIDPPQTWTIASESLENGDLEMTAVAGNPYWTARLRYGDATRPPQPENAGFTITRSWVAPRLDAATGRPTWNMGDTVEVTVTINVPSSRQHVLLFDPFPAGLEPLYASRTDVAEAARTYQYPWQFQESRPDGMLLYAERVAPGEYTYTYTLRAAAPGVFVQRPSRVEEMYTPEVFGRTTGDIVEVKP